MKILVVCQHYKPEPFRISDICEALVERGHEVTVVTGVPNYPEGVIYPGYEKGAKRRENINGVTVHRCFTVPRKTGVVYRFLNYYSFALSSSFHAPGVTAQDGSGFDVVLVNQLSPVMMAEAAIAYKKKYKTPVVMYCLDLWPESLTAGGIGRTSPIFKVFHHISRRIYRAMDRILVTSRMFCGYLQEHFEIAPERMDYLPQYAEGIFEPTPPKEPGPTVDLLFAGNIGAAQSVETVLEAAECLREECPQLRWHIVGGGSELERLQELASKKQLSNVIFHGRRPLEEMPGFYAKADAMLVTLGADPVLSLTLPGKVQSYMAAGKPILGAIDGETGHVIEEANCGFCGKASDGKALAENIRRFLACGDREQLGKNGRAYYEKYFSREKFMDKLERTLEEAVRQA